jgi:uncharacterized membrane protein YhaH (DUF805 family)
MLLCFGLRGPKDFTLHLLHPNPKSLSLRWAMNLVRLMLNPMGRIGRRDYWIGVAIITAVVVLANWVDGGVGAVLGCSTIYLGICVAGKRLHDFGQSAWGVLMPVCFCMVIIVLTLLTGGFSNPTGQPQGLPDTPLAVFVDALPVLIFLIWPAWVIWLGVRKSQLQDNQYGPGPQSVSINAALD